jgi:acetyl esterase/lipase
MDITHEPHAVCGKAGDKDLTLQYMFRSDLADRIKPVVALIPGGGWLHGGITTVNEPSAFTALLDLGLMVVCLRHRPITEAAFPACRDDIRTALDWLIDNAADLKIDPDAIALDGGSAGGHLAALTAAIEAKHQSPHPIRAAILRGPPMDIKLWFEQINDNEVLNGCVRKLLGGTPAEQPELCREATPLTHVSPGMPPFLIFHGDKDVAVPLSHSEALEQQLQRVGGQVTRIIVKNGTHGLTPADDSGCDPSPEQIGQIKRDFLRQHLLG